ncbi:MAG: NUDIX domain-containing protein [Candidatus Doudnabacteria bacterium]|nr:NUDIX domain-containing protein [Candidatus Doudnabacteria bacterium]
MTEERSQLRKKWKKEISAGGIVFKKQDGRAFVLMIMPRKRVEMKDPLFVPAWTFPKGWVGDHGEETLEQTATREIREEGGVNGKIIDKLGEVKYFFKWQGDDIFKTVHVYLLEYIDGDPNDHDKEVDVAKWFDIKEAGEFLKYKADKDMLRKAQAIIKINGNIR